MKQSRWLGRSIHSVFLPKRRPLVRLDVLASVPLLTLRKCARASVCACVSLYARALADSAAFFVRQVRDVSGRDNPAITAKPTLCWYAVRASSRPLTGARSHPSPGLLRAGYLGCRNPHIRARVWPATHHANRGPRNERNEWLRSITEESKAAVYIRMQVDTHTPHHPSAPAKKPWPEGAI
ncbi:hypothetical protein MRX96_028557 [Rhipicephalus microplus]